MEREAMYQGTPGEALAPDTVTWGSLCRENTGRAMCDSGDFYGRHWERPPSKPPRDGIARWDKYGVTLSTEAYLEARFPIDRGLQNRWAEFDAASDEDLTWAESVDAFMKREGYVELSRGNVYNEPNDLSQVFQWSVWAKPDADARGWTQDAATGAWGYINEWWYLDGLVTVIRVHTGCDVRGGYSRPGFSTGADWESVLCAGFSAGIRAVSGTDAEGGELDDSELAALCESWDIGYSREPGYRFSEDVEEWVEEPRRGENGRWTGTVKLKSGETVTAEPDAPGEW